MILFVSEEKNEKSFSFFRRRRISIVNFFFSHSFSLAKFAAPRSIVLSKLWNT